MNAIKGKQNAPLLASLVLLGLKGEGMCRVFTALSSSPKEAMRRTLPTLNDFRALSGLSVEFSFRHLVHSILSYPSLPVPLRILLLSEV